MNARCFQMKQLNVKDPAEVPAIVLRRKHAFRYEHQCAHMSGYALDFQ